jgi:CDP-glucose 4,6-dehydratase
LDMTNKYWKYKRVLVTGAAGFLGSHLSSALYHLGAEVVGLDNSNNLPAVSGNWGEYIDGDVRNYDILTRTLSRYEIQVIFHLAAVSTVSISKRNPMDAFTTNVNGVVNVLEAARQYDEVEYIVCASTDKVYGELGDRPAYIETDPICALNPYDCSKACGDLIAQTYWKAYGLPIGITRNGNMYGGGDMNWNRLIPNTIRRIHAGLNPQVWGTGNETRDFLYIDDAVNGYIKMAEHKAQGIFNFATGHQSKVMDVITKIGSLMEAQIEIEVLGVGEDEIKNQCLDWSKAHDLLGWEADNEIGEGLTKAVAWYRSYLANG